MTFNEPQIFILAAYVAGASAPFEHVSMTAVTDHLRHMLLAHGRAVRVIRETAEPEPVVGIAMAAGTYIPDSEDCNAEARPRTMLGWVIDRP